MAERVHPSQRAPRNTTTRDRHRRVIARMKPPCGICGEPIDYSLHYLDPMAYTVDHIIPLAKGGSDELDNKQAAHRDCNRGKSDRLDYEPEPEFRTFVTSRTW